MFEVVRNSIRQIPRLRFVLSIIVVLTMVGVIFYVLTPDLDRQKTEVNFDGSVTTFSGTTYVGGSISPPDEFTTYRFLGYVPPTDIQRELLVAYGAVVDDLDPELWRGDGVIIAKINNPERFSIQTEEAEVATSSALPTANSFKKDPVEISNAWVNKYLPNHNLVSIDADIEYFSGTYELAVAPKNLATLVKVPYAQRIDQFPIRTDSRDGYPLLIYVNIQQNQVTKVVLYPTIYDFEPNDEQIPSVSVDDAVQQINNEKVQVLGAVGSDMVPISLEKFDDGRLSRASIEYRLRFDNQLVPYYHFVGTFFDSSNTPITADVVTPAIQ